LAAAVTIRLQEGGKLTGAIGVVVNGATYDVSFKDGSCSAIFGGCDGPGDFAFNTLAEANMASQSLLDQVFIGQFDDDPALTNGCGITGIPSSTAFCGSWTPYQSDGTSFAASIAENTRTHPTDFFGIDRISEVANPALSPDIDFGTNQAFATGITFARWTAVPVSVPEPPAAMLLIAGVLVFRTASLFRRC